MISPYDFEDIVVVSDDGIVKVELEWIGEGEEGDYDENDPEDVPLIRYAIFRKCSKDDDENDIYSLCEIPIDDGDRWYYVQDSSYCTQLPVTAPRDQLIEAAKYILYLVEDGVRSFNREKRLYETISWVGLLDGKPYCQQGAFLDRIIQART
jgi:hypothetical protein